MCQDYVGFWGFWDHLSPGTLPSKSWLCPSGAPQEESQVLSVHRGGEAASGLEESRKGRPGEVIFGWALRLRKRRVFFAGATGRYFREDTGMETGRTLVGELIPPVGLGARGFSVSVPLHSTAV